MPLQAARGARILRGMLRGTLLLTCALAWAAAAAQDAPARDVPVLVVTRDVQLDPAAEYGGLVIEAHGVTVDGRGARITGPVLRAARAAGTPPDPAAFTGTGVRARGVDGVTLRGLRVEGFALGLAVEDASGWRIEGCDLSDNLHDPAFGWGEPGERGGLLLVRVRDSVLAGNRAQRNWNACSLVECDRLELRDNAFSHASNTCLKLWTVTRSTFADNDLSWGLRIAPGEVHARDSTGVLIESGSDDNLFLRNDASHGGDGFFIRVLNNWTSRRNRFEGNDASWCNNNGFEAWSPENTYVGNRASHCSYGFWLGASDRTVLLGNEAGWNGDPGGFHNAPESFGHGGIVFVNGPSHHTLVDGNWLHHNAGGGLVLRGDEATGGRAWKAWHWVIQRNRLEANRWGVWMRHAEFIDIGPNAFRDNREGDVFDAGNVSGVVFHEGPQAGEAPVVQVRRTDGDAGSGDTRVRLEAAAAGDGPAAFRWSLGDGAFVDSPALARVLRGPAWRRAGVTVTRGGLSGLGWCTVLLPGPGDDELPATRAGAPPAWTLVPEGASDARFEPAPGIAPDEQAVHARIAPGDGSRASLLWPATRDAHIPLAGRTQLAFWIRTRNPNIPAWQDGNPVVTLHQSAERWLRLVPERDLLADPPDVHFRDEWMPLVLPLAGGDGWRVETGPAGAPDTLEWLTLGLDPWGTPPLDLWLDRLGLR